MPDDKYKLQKTNQASVFHIPDKTDQQKFMNSWLFLWLSYE